jgi:hypothetical protein
MGRMTLGNSTRSELDKMGKTSRSLGVSWLWGASKVISSWFVVIKPFTSYSVISFPEFPHRDAPGPGGLARQPHFQNAVFIPGLDPLRVDGHGNMEAALEDPISYLIMEHPVDVGRGKGPPLAPDNQILAGQVNAQILQDRAGDFQTDNQTLGGFVEVGGRPEGKLHSPQGKQTFAPGVHPLLQVFKIPDYAYFYETVHKLCPLRLNDFKLNTPAKKSRGIRTMPVKVFMASLVTRISPALDR